MMERKKVWPLISTTITTMIMTIMSMGMIITTDTATAIRTVMAIAIPIRTVGMITTTMGTIMTTATIMITTIMCITRMARRITARALPACMCPA